MSGFITYKSPFGNIFEECSSDVINKILESPPFLFQSIDHLPTVTIALGEEDSNKLVIKLEKFGQELLFYCLLHKNIAMCFL